MCHGEAVKRYQVLIDGSELSCHDEIVSVRAKNKAPARRPTAPIVCLGSRISPGAIKFDKKCDFTLIDATD
jgi:hypothetical protein